MDDKVILEKIKNVHESVDLLRDNFKVTQKDVGDMKVTLGILMDRSASKGKKSLILYGGAISFVLGVVTLAIRKFA